MGCCCHISSASARIFNKKHRHADLVDLHHDLHRDLDLGALHAQEGEHGEDGQQGGRCVRDDIGQGVVAVDKDKSFD